MAAGRRDRLSELPDDLLRRILHFAPLKEAASTTALSRRWRAPLWLSCGAVNLEAALDSNARFFYRRDNIFTAAKVTQVNKPGPARTYSGDHYKKTVYVDEINAPRLHSFKYHGTLHSFSFSPQPPQELEQVDLYFFWQRNDDDDWNYNKDPIRDLETFWRLARIFTSTRKMRLRVQHLEDIAVLSEPSRVKLLPSFHRLQHLELQGVRLEEGKIATITTILNLLRCCPVLSALRINLTEQHKDDASNKKDVLRRTQVPQKEIQIAAMLGPSHFYQCLQSSLRGVCLQFRLENSYCLGEKLIKFFAEKAMVLEEMLIDAGDEKFCKDMNTKAEKWNSKRTKLGATSFVVLPFKSRLYQEWKF